MTGDSSSFEARSIGAEFAAALGFLTRLPVERFGLQTDERPDFRSAARTFPLVGAVVGVAGGLVLALAHALHLPPIVSGALAVATTIAITGALHEDGLADTADGFGGGDTAAKKLEIMRDSRIGTFGALALVLSVLLRAGLLAALLSRGALHAALVLIAAESVGRAALVHLWHSLPSARLDGLAGRTGQPDSGTLLVAMVMAGAIGLVFGTIGAGVVAALVALAATAAITLAFERLCAAQIAGQTGDTLGAVEQVALTTFLLATVAFG